MEHSFAIAYSSEENGIVERANQELLRQLRALGLIVASTTSGHSSNFRKFTPAELIISHSIRLSSHIMTPLNGVDSSDTSLSVRMDEWISRQHTLLVVAQENQLKRAGGERS